MKPVEMIPGDMVWLTPQGPTRLSPPIQCKLMGYELDRANCTVLIGETEGLASKQDVHPTYKAACLRAAKIWSDIAQRADENANYYRKMAKTDGKKIETEG